MEECDFFHFEKKLFKKEISVVVWCHYFFCTFLCLPVHRETCLQLYNMKLNTNKIELGHTVKDGKSISPTEDINKVFPRQGWHLQPCLVVPYEKAPESARLRKI